MSHKHHDDCCCNCCCNPCSCNNCCNSRPSCGCNPCGGCNSCNSRPFPLCGIGGSPSCGNNCGCGGGLLWILILFALCGRR